MSDPAGELRAAAAERVTGGAGGPHLSEDEVAAYHAGTLPAERAARALDHLLGCRDCTELLLGLEELTGEEDEPVPPAELAAAWQAMRARLPLPSPAPPVPLPFPPSRRTAPPVWLGALAAALLVAVVGLSVSVVSLRRTVDELSRPQVDTPILDLFPEPLRGGRDEVPALELAPGARFFLLVFTPRESRSFGRYEGELARGDGTVVWRGALRRNQYGSFSLVVARRQVRPGTYRLRLWGKGAAGREPLGEYDLRVVSQSAGG